jgi:hypothetical protein
MGPNEVAHRPEKSGDRGDAGAGGEAGTVGTVEEVIAANSL